MSRLKLNDPRVPRSWTLVRAVALSGIELSQHIVDSVSWPLNRIAGCILDRPIVRRTGDLLAGIGVDSGRLAETHHSVSVQVLRSSEPSLGAKSVRLKTGEGVKLLRNLIRLDCMLV